VSCRREEGHVRALEYTDQRHPCNKTSDVREECHASAGAADAHASAQELHDKPEAQHDSRGHPHHAHPRHEHEHVCTWKEQDIGAKHAGNRAAGAHHRDRGRGIRDCVTQRRQDAASEVKDHKARMPHHILDVVAEDPEIEHVADQMHPASVHEHASQERDVGRDVDRD